MPAPLAVACRFPPAPGGGGFSGAEAASFVSRCRAREPLSPLIGRESRRGAGTGPCGHQFSSSKTRLFS